jgi:cytochrome b561
LAIFKSFIEMYTSLQNRYGGVTQSFHWITAILVVSAFVLGLGGSEQSVYSAGREFERQLHETLGIAVFGLTFLRLGWKLIDSSPVTDSIPRWMEVTSKMVQGFLYLLLLAVPATAIAGAWLEGHPVTLLAGIQFAPPMNVSHDLGVTFVNAHTFLGDAVIWIAAAHAFAAIYHHLVLRDTVLLSMLPRWLPLRKL